MPKSIRSAVALNLRNARIAAGFETVSDAARHIGIPVPTAIAHEGKGSSFRKPKLEHLRRYAIAYNTTIDALEGGTVVAAEPAKATPSRPLPPLQNLTGAPVLGTAQAGHWREVDPIAEASGTYVQAKGTDVFAINVAGDSMNRVVQDGDIAIVKPWANVRRDARNADILLVQRERNGRFELTVKTYRDGQLWPESTNPKWRHPVKMNDGDIVTIVGLVTGLYRTL